MTEKNNHHHHHSGWDQLRSFSLWQALFGRRSRRFGLGMEIPSGPLAYQSKHVAQPLSEEERLLLIALGSGLTGWNLGIPHSTSTPESLGCNYAHRSLGRSYPSGAATYGSELLITDDSGSYITQWRNVAPTGIQEPFNTESPEAFLSSIRPYVKQLSKQRVSLPAEYPHIGTHNHWVANKPGSTLFVPVADQAESLLNLLWIYTSEGSPILDVEKTRYLGNPKRLFKSGHLLEERAIGLGVVETVTVKHTTAEMSIAAYNIQLALQAMGLGGWLYTGINGTSLLGEFAADGLAGFGFRFERSSKDESLNPVGLDGIFEPLVPPYVGDMKEAVHRFYDRRFGKHGTYAEGDTGPFRDNRRVKSKADSASSEWLDYLAGLTQDILETYGKFPATIPTVSVGLYTQAQHIDLDFYDEHYQPGAYLDTHSTHQQDWHGKQ